MSSSPGYTFSVPFSYNGSAQSRAQFRLPVAPFCSGTWFFETEPTEGKIAISCSDVTSFVRVDAVSLGKQQADLVRGKAFPPSPNWSMSCPTGGTDSGLSVTLYVNFTSDVESSWLAHPPRDVAKTNTDFLHSRTPNDVVLYFPRSKRELWANSAALKQASAHFATLLDSGFKEDETAARESGADDATLNEADMAEDSDTETDLVPLDRDAVRKESKIAAGVKEIVVDYAAYTTYRAVLTYIHSGFIEFAPLRPPPKGSLSRKHAPIGGGEEKKASTQSSRIPLAPSPKSIYHLAHFLEMTDLEKLALDNLESQLTPENVLYQLTTDIAIFEPVKEALIAFAVAKWATVRETAAMKQLQDMDALQSLPNPLIATASMSALMAKCSQMAV